jgi:glycosyltransferase involved in cell wall biosynthesis
MKIGIDASRAVNERAGIGRYTREVVRRLIEEGESDEFRLFFSFVRDDGTKRRWIEDVSKHRDNVRVRVSMIPGQLKEWLWGQQFWSISRYLPGSDVILAPSFFEAALGETIPQVVTMHDCSHALFPDQRGEGVSRRLTERNKLIARKAAGLLAPSKATADDLVQLFGVDPERITVIPHGYNEYFQEVSGVAREPFFLFVGTISPRKNLIGLFHAFAALPDDIRRTFKLIVVGAEGWNTGETYETYVRLGLGDRVEFRGYESDESLRKLYNKAAGFLFPSLYEGFGIPILEAMACGCPVIASNTSSMPEVAGNAAVLVDPTNPARIAEAMEKIATDPRLWARLHTVGLARVKEFSWDKTATHTLETLHAVGRSA